MNHQIITSLFDLDWYKLLELYYKFYYHPRDVMREETLNRTLDVRVADIVPIEALREQLDAARTLYFTEPQIAFMQGTRVFVRKFATFSQYIRGFQLPEYEIVRKDGQYIVSSEDPDALYWETFWLAIKNELVSHYQAKKLGLSQHDIWNEGERVLREKLPLLAQLPRGSVLEFGTRRRYSKAWQAHVWEILQNELPEYIADDEDWLARIDRPGSPSTVNVVNATSNVELAMNSFADWAGTQPHAAIMLEQGLAAPWGEDAIRDSHRILFDQWGELFPYNNLMALTDTYGNAAFWQDFGQENARKWRGLRWDSGDWREFINEAREFYYQMHIDPRDPVTGKDVAFTDGLTAEEMLAIYPVAAPHFRNVVFGWGTNLTNDMGRYKAQGLKPFSLVAKPTEVNGYQVGKLSNNRGKATGKVASKLAEIFNYNQVAHENVVPVV